MRDRDDCCCGVCKLEVQQGMTHGRDWSLESNRPKTSDLMPQEGKRIDEATTGLVHRQPL